MFDMRSARRLELEVDTQCPACIFAQTKRLAILRAIAGCFAFYTRGLCRLRTPQMATFPISWSPRVQLDEFV